MANKGENIRKKSLIDGHPDALDDGLVGRLHYLVVVEGAEDVGTVGNSGGSLGLASAEAAAVLVGHALDDLELELSFAAELALGGRPFVAGRPYLDAYLFEGTYLAGGEDVGLLVLLGEVVAIHQRFRVGPLSVEFPSLPVGALVAPDAQGIVDARTPVLVVDHILEPGAIQTADHLVLALFFRPAPQSDNLDELLQVDLVDLRAGVQAVEVLLRGLPLLALPAGLERRGVGVGVGAFLPTADVLFEFGCEGEGLGAFLAVGDGMVVMVAVQEVVKVDCSDFLFLCLLTTLHLYLSKPAQPIA